MNRIRNIGVALDGSAMAVRGLSLAVWLASRLSARIYVLNADGPGPPEEALARLGVPRKYWPALQLRQLAGDAAGAILEAEQAEPLDALVMSARGASREQDTQSEPTIIGHVAREVIERSSAPVLLLPPGYEEDLPWHTALVPLSGEVGPDDALTLALRLATRLDLSVTVAHVAADAERSAVELGAGRYADELHHEYPGRLNELVDRACPLCSVAERSRIESFVLCHGDIGGELVDMARQHCRGVIVVGWHGQLVAGRAHVVKTLLEQVSCPLLLVKASAHSQPFRLKVGEGV